MIINSMQANRLAIYFFYDAEGIVDDYVMYFLEELKKEVQRIVIVCNGKLSVEGRTRFGHITKELLVRENKGFDGWAYKAGLDYLGWECLGEYDEIIMMNHTIMGPLYPLNIMFEEMDRRDLDFWGITKHYKVDFDPFGGCEYGYIPEHIQSHFIVIRKSMVTDCSFQDYWNNFPEILSYNDAVAKHEAIFTQKFSDKGFSWDVYVDMDDESNMNRYPLMYLPIKMIHERKCPIFKRKIFFQNHWEIVANSVGNMAKDLFKYVDKHTGYDVNMIWDNLLRTCNQSDIVRCLNLEYTLSSTVSDSKYLEPILKNRRIALVMHLYFTDLIQEMYNYASYMPEETDIFITTNTEEKKEAITSVFEKLPKHHIEVRVITNRGRDVSSLLVGVKDVIMNYDFACFVHDKKTVQLNPGTVGLGFSYKCFENTLHSKKFVENVICLLEENPRLGILSPPSPNHADFFSSIGREWGMNYELTKQLAEKLNLTVPISQEKAPIAPYGTLFWFRPEAMRILYDEDWQYEDFPPEPNHIDGTVLHAIERIYPIIVQQEGFYPAILMSDDFNAIEYTNLYYYLKLLMSAVETDVNGNVTFASLQTAGDSKESYRKQIENLELEKENCLEYIKYLENTIESIQSNKKNKIRDKAKNLVNKR